ncbi:phosphosulfolactate synthase [Numidum massiliense]|uniref:phosphosulfolactate synthase n=1 Tax=Numidum massiliense TaxID=1522315 RepID=UPI0006D57914|nr:phosphosulfolactate synthase [Numidum massiliense]
MDWNWVNRRAEKPRVSGVTMVIDTGIGPRIFADLLESAGRYIDFVKLGFGTTALTAPHILQQKLELAKKHDVLLFPGGTFFELAYAKGQWETYLEKMEALGFPAVEISEGTLSLPETMREQIVRAASQSFHVLTEVGKKTKGSHVTLEELAQTYASDIACGASYVIVEGRESGKDVGIYDADGRLDPQFVLAARKETGKKLLWEAPLKSQQVDLIRLFGPDVNLGNVSTGSTLAVEALRRGLRADTFSLNFRAEVPI